MTEKTGTPHFSPTVLSGPFVFVSGQMAFGKDGTVEGSIAEQTTTCLQRIEKLLGSRGLSRRDIVKATVWIRQASDFAKFNAAYAAFFGDCLPARSTVVCELAVPEAMVEIEAIASLPIDVIQG